MVQWLVHWLKSSPPGLNHDGCTGVAPPPPPEFPKKKDDVSLLGSLICTIGGINNTCFWQPILRCSLLYVSEYNYSDLYVAQHSDYNVI
jgi:hypothetical protein